MTKSILLVAFIVSTFYIIFLISDPNRIENLLIYNTNEFIVLNIYFIISLYIFLDKKARNFALKYTRNLLSLKTEVSVYSRTNELKELHTELSDRIDKLSNSLRDISPESTVPTVLSKDEIEKSKNVAFERAVTLMSEEIRVAVDAKAKEHAISNIESKSLERLSELSVVLGTRANAALVMGVIFCSLGLAALIISFFFITPTSTTSGENGWVEIIKNYAPRFAIVLIIEVIGFFFLKLYKSALSEIRYTQNEITNVEMRLIALHAASTLDSPQADAVINSLVKTDRNSIIEKGQTTSEIEKYRAQADSEKSILEAVSSIIHGTEKSSFWRRGNGNG